MSERLATRHWPNCLVKLTQKGFAFLFPSVPDMGTENRGQVFHFSISPRKTARY